MAIPDTSTSTLPRAFPLAEAARRMGVTEAILQNMIQSGQIPAFQAPDGQMLVPMTTEKTTSLPVAVADDDINARLAAIKREDFEELEGVPITVSEAAKKYGVPVATIHTWVHRGYITPLGKKGRQRQIDEAEIAYCAQIYHVRRPFGTRAPLLEKDGSPYLLREPELARLRRRAKLVK